MATVKQGQSTERARWEREISAALKDYTPLHTSGDSVVDTYRIEARSSSQRDKYNILYSITETIKPSMYSQTPKPEVKRRQIDRKNPIVVGATLLIESAVQYTIDEQDFDDVIAASVEDFLLPGLGQVWCRYEPTITKAPLTGGDGAAVIDANGVPAYTEVKSYEQVAVDYVFWKDFLTSKGRRWAEKWWVARRVYMDKAGVTEKFGADIAAVCQFTDDKNVNDKSRQDLDEKQIAVWEVYNKKAREVIWYSEGYKDGLLKVSPDFLNLKGFFPCPRPLRAVSTNNKFVPRAFYAQYQAQADELNDVTFRIRKLVDALRVVGVYDASVPSLQNILTGAGNRMVPVDNWAVMAEKGGIKGTIDFLPITEVANVLLQLYDARDRVKGEIYEITGWSDIIRGVSKASETLGAQQIKAEWAGARLKLLQKDVQRFVRDIFRIVGELCSEHFSDEMLMLMAGYEPDPSTPEGIQEIQIFKQVIDLLRSEKDRCALIGVESDSTLLPDEANDRKERMEFLGSAGAFLQQAVPAAKETPALGPLLGQILMFAVRSFRSARSLEAEFEQFVETLKVAPAQQPPSDEKGGPDPAIAEAKMADIQAKTSIAQSELAQGDKHHNADMSLKLLVEQNRHSEKEAELALRTRELDLRERELEMKAREFVRDTVDTSIDRQLSEAGRQEDRADRAREAAENRAVQREDDAEGENA